MYISHTLPLLLSISTVQGITIASSGPCVDDEGGRDDGDFDGSETVDTTAVITLQDMKAFEHENFQLVAKRRPEAIFRNDQPRHEAYENYSASSASARESSTSLWKATRVTDDGLEYVSKSSSFPTNINIPDETPAYSGSASDSIRSRFLVVLGRDTRSRVSNTRDFPFRTVVEVDYNSGSGGCSGTLIAPNTVLTAGHCIYDNGRYFRFGGVAPGRNGNSDPYGRFSVRSRTVLSEWTNGRYPRNYDMGVLQLQPRGGDVNDPCNTQAAGNIVGFVGIKKSTSSGVGSIMISGYPSDKGGGQLWTSGSCSWNNAESGFGTYSCDTAAGQSGSSTMTSSSFHAIGVHGYGLSDRNGATMLNNERYNQVFTWAGLDNRCGGNNAPPPTPQPVGGQPNPPTPRPRPPTPRPTSRNQAVEDDDDDVNGPPPTASTGGGTCQGLFALFCFGNK